MKIVYVANACGHISGPLCDKLYQVYGKDFAFIATDDLDSDRKGIGAAASCEYVIDANKDKEYAKKLCDEAEVVIFGAAPVEYIKNRIIRNQLTIYYSERLFKNKLIRYLNPITFYNLHKRFIRPGKNSNFHLLCASSFAATDFYRIGAFRNKMYKWGYQPTVYRKDIEAVLSSKPQDGLQFIWVGRLVGLKHCDDAIRVIARLRNEGYNARMNIVGTGDQEQALKMLAEELNVSQHINFMGRCLIEDTRRMMDDANIFMFTSDFSEGWGVTLNECMNSGVACVASHGAGSTNFLIDNEKNGLVYQSGNLEDLYQKVKRLVDNKQLRRDLGRKAYESIYSDWNPDSTYKRMIEFIEQLQEKGCCDLFAQGPLSRALPLSHNWYSK